MEFIPKQNIGTKVIKPSITKLISGMPINAKNNDKT
jgi:hypothetical protein